MKKKKGLALLWSLVLSSVLLIISGTMVSYIVKESQFSVRIQDSTQAYSYAKSGVELGLEYLSTPGIKVFPKTYSGFDLSGDGEKNNLSVSIVKSATSGDCQSPALYCIYSTGSVGEVNRKLEHLIYSNPSTLITPINPVSNTNIGKNEESFLFQFDFWLPGNQAFNFGLGNSTNTVRIFLSLNQTDGAFRLGRTHAGTTIYSNGEFRPYDDPDRLKPYIYRAKIRYIKDTAATMTVQKRNDSGEYTCIDSISLNLNGADFGNLERLYINPIPTYSPGVLLASNRYNSTEKYIEIYSSSGSLSDIIANIIINR